MHTLPEVIISLLNPFERLFHPKTWRKPNSWQSEQSWLHTSAQ